ncbi:MAG: lysophospholipid acyltransferase family protein [Verrucomicrobia bacterium]|nr:lysophospholipid acyltransferase family protein [Verrucomicrobiota bacterium]
MIKILCRLFSALPLGGALRLGRGLGWLFGNVFRYHRSDASEALGVAFPEMSAVEKQAILNRMYKGFGMNLAELLRLNSMKAEDLMSRVEGRGLENLVKALEGGKGVIAVTAHIGNYDLLAMACAAFGHPITIISKVIKNEKLNEFWQELRARFGIEILPPKNSYRECRQALKRNRMLGFILDQNMIAKEGIFVDFFGKSACTTPGLAFLAAQAQCPIIPAFMIRKPGGRHEIIMFEAIEPPDNRDADEIRRVTQECTKVIEDVIRRYPDQWTWIHRRWRTKPKDNRPGRDGRTGIEDPAGPESG